jgi:hypothetical protein
MLPHLEEVDITVPGCGLDILQCLEAPTLRSVRLDGSREDGCAEEWHDEVLLCLHHSSACLSNHGAFRSSISIALRSCDRTHTICQTDFTYLEELRIKGLTITDEAFAQPSSHSHCQRRLELIGCEGITASGLIAYINARQPSVRAEDFQLLVSGCPGVEERRLEFRIYDR